MKLLCPCWKSTEDTQIPNKANERKIEIKNVHPTWANARFDNAPNKS